MNLKSDLFQFDNYRTFLQDFFDSRKETQKYFSQRYFAKKAGFTDHSQLTHIVSGRRNITNSVLEQLLVALELDGHQKDFFVSLVNFNQCDTVDEKEMWYDKLNDIRVKSGVYKLSLKQFKFYENWYNSIILEVAVLNNWDHNYIKLAKFVRPKITAAQAKESIKLLMKIGMLYQDEQGKYYKNSSIIIPGDVPLYALKKARHDLIKLSLHASEDLSPQERYFHNFGFGISKGKKEKYMEIMERFKDEIEGLVANDNEPPEEMFQFNLQFFPVTTKLNEESK